MGQRKMYDNQRQQSANIPETNIPKSDSPERVTNATDNACPNIPVSSELYRALIEWAERPNHLNP